MLKDDHKVRLIYIVREIAPKALGFVVYDVDKLRKSLICPIKNTKKGNLHVPNSKLDLLYNKLVY